MITYTACTLLAVIWLWYRLFQFLRIPVFKIVGLLNIELPQSTKVSVDKITQDSITLHWENEPDCIYTVSGVEENHHRFKVVSYKLYLDGKLVGNFPNTKRAYTFVHLRGLASGQTYQLDLVTVNQLGFTNKLPNVFVMTLPGDTKLESSVPPVPEQEEAQIMEDLTHLLPADVKWRKPLMITQSTKTATPSYSSLTTLNDLEGFSIQDLKNILVCSQEDLHDVLQQHSMILQDFNDTKLQLQMELDNLKVQWNHEIELKKSMKSTINSLESSKVLYDLKREKLERSIKQIETKISKMNKDMDSWTKNDDIEKKKETLQEKYRKMSDKLNDAISATSEQVKKLQEEIAQQEDENKKLNQIKKLMDNESNGSASHQNQNSSSDSSTINWAQVMKKINESTVQRSGLLSSSGEDLLNSLPQQTSLVQAIKSELEIDQKLDNQWKASKSRFNKRIDHLERVWKELQTKNIQLKNELTLQTYSMSQQPSQSGINNDMTNHNPTHQLHLHDPSSYANYNTSGSLLAQTVASAPFTSWLQQGQQQHQQQQQTPLAAAADPTQSLPTSSHEPFYHNAEYEDSSHLISGLENMVADVADKPRTALLFTNDQLDEYWNSSSQISRPFSPSSLPPQNQPQPPTQPSHQQSLSQHQIAPIVSSDSSLSPVPQFKPHTDRSFLGVLNDAPNDDVISFHSALNNGATTSPMMVPSKTIHSVPDSAFSPSFHSIWNDSGISSPHSSNHAGTDNQNKPWIFNQPLDMPSAPAPERPKESSTRRMSKLFARGTQLFKLPSHDSQ